MSLRKSVKRLMASVPSFLVTACWLALWLVWPRLVSSEASQVAPAEVVVHPHSQNVLSIYRSPKVFGPPSPVGFSTMAREKRELKLLSHRAALPPQLLARSSGNAELTRGSRDTWSQVEPTYNPILRRATPVPAVGATVRKIHVLQSSELIKEDFVLPGMPPELAERTNAYWEVMARVELDKKGRVEHVFIEEQGENSETARWVEQFLAGGRARASEGMRSGRVTVGCVAQ